MHPFFAEHRNRIADTLKNFFLEHKSGLTYPGAWGADMMDRFFLFSTQGKMIRGGLVILGHTLFADDISDAVMKTAAAIEIIHSSLLIHDDIMDRDDLRRGEKTFHIQYEEEWMKRGTPEPEHYGKSLAICAGDIGFFLAFNLLSTLDIDPFTRSNILSLWSKELTTVGLAQMQDVSFSLFSDDIIQKDILDLYRFKTARYTFSLPLATGALLAEQKEDVIQSLESFGELVGIIFQIKDDEIEFFGDSQNTGKSPGSDFREGKKTLFHLHLQNLLEAKAIDIEKKRGVSSIPPNERRFLTRILENHTTGNRRVTETDLAQLRRLVDKYKIGEKIQRTIQEFRRKAEQKVDQLPVGDKKKSILVEILDSSIARTY
jgi:geranylgeranyl diphosphate synthase type I